MSERRAKTEHLNGLGFNLGTVKEISRHSAEPAWVRESRLQAWRSYEAIPMPDASTEGWRRTDISGLRLQEMAPVLAAGKLTKAGAPPRKRPGFDGLVAFNHSEVLQEELDAALGRQGVIFTSVTRALREHPTLVREHLATGHISPGDGKFDALNGAFWDGGVFLYVPDGVSVALPLEARFTASVPGLAVVAHNVIVLGDGSRLTYVETQASRPRLGRLLHSAVTEVHLGVGAAVKLVAFQDWSPNVYSFTTQRIIAGRDSSVEVLNVALGGRLTRGATDVALSGSGAKARVLGLCFGDGEQQFDQSTLQDHQAPDTTSDLLYKGALKERARSVFTGLVRVRKAAQRTDALLTRRDLLLGEESKADSLPILEIEANDVRCSHAAAMGPVDEEQTFYLTSRGLEPGDAEKLIVMGFFEDLLDKAGFAPLRDRIRRSIERKLERGSASEKPAST